MRYDDLRALGRIGQPQPVRRRRAGRLITRGAGEPLVATRRPVIPKPILVAVGLLVSVLTYLGVVAAGQSDGADQASLTRTAAAASATGEVAAPATAPRRSAMTVDRSGRSPVQAGSVFARVEGLELVLPHEQTLKVAFHEANRPEALPMDPVGVLEGNDNAERYIAPADAEGPGYHILSSRGRGRPPTSAVDIVLPDGGVALAPVTGTVTEVRRYVLSDGVQDWRVVIEPDARKDLNVVVIHLHEPQVAVGDRVEAGSSAIAVARLLPFTSHVDYVVGERHPHVHVEVKPYSTGAPIDPNAPAVELGAEEDALF